MRTALAAANASAWAGPVGRKHARPGRCRGDAHQAEPAAELQRLDPVQVAGEQFAGQGDPARPLLGPERQLVLARVILLEQGVQEHVGVGRAQQFELAPAEVERVLDHLCRCGQVEHRRRELGIHQRQATGVPAVRRGAPRGLWRRQLVQGVRGRPQPGEVLAELEALVGGVDVVLGQHRSHVHAWGGQRVRQRPLRPGPALAGEQRRLAEGALDGPPGGQVRRVVDRGQAGPHPAHRGHGDLGTRRGAGGHPLLEQRLSQLVLVGHEPERDLAWASAGTIVLEPKPV